MTDERAVRAHDLFWWRNEAGGVQTSVSIYWPTLRDEPGTEARLQWYDDVGALIAEQVRPLPAGTHLVISSDRPPADVQLRDGVLSVEVLAPSSSFEPTRRDRLYAVVDWWTAAGDVVSLHSDHCVMPSPVKLELTEVVLRPDRQRRPQLVFLTGDEPVAAGSWTLTITNAVGDRLTRSIDRRFEPWRVHRVDLDDLFGDLVSFAAGAELSLDGARGAHQMFERPYVVSEAPVLAAYHGGDRYDWEPLDGVQHLFLGEGEVNPMLVVQSSEMQTEVTFLHTHGDLDDGFWIGARLYDAAGRLVADVPTWRFVQRDVLASASLAELVPAELESFVGHVAFTFSEGGLPEYPGHLQALMAYTGGETCARIMAWSDQWNTSPRRLALRTSGGHYESYFRTPSASCLEAWVGITYCGAADLDSVARYRLIVRAADGEEAAIDRELAPWATEWGTVESLVTQAAAMLSAGPCLVVVESEFDLAMVCFTRHRVSGRWAAEHFMSAPVAGRDGEVWPAGS